MSWIPDILFVNQVGTCESSCGSGTTPSPGGGGSSNAPPSPTQATPALLSSQVQRLADAAERLASNLRPLDPKPHNIKKKICKNLEVSWPVPSIISLTFSTSRFHRVSPVAFLFIQMIKFTRRHWLTLIFSLWIPVRCGSCVFSFAILLIFRWWWPCLTPIQEEWRKYENMPRFMGDLTANENPKNHWRFMRYLWMKRLLKFADLCRHY